MAQSNVELCINAMYVNKMPFLTTISQNIKFRTRGWVPDKTAKSYQEQLAKVLHLYKIAGFLVTIFNSDNEFCPVLEPMKQEFGFQPNYASAQEHVPEAKRNHRVIKERVRTCFHNAPFKSLPCVAIKYLVTESTAKLNFFPAKRGCSKTYSLHQIILQKPLIYKWHCKIPTLQTVLAHNEPTPLNLMQARAIEGLFLGATKNAQGGFKIYNLETKSVITRKYVTEIPTTPAMIQRDFAKGMENITITSKTGELLYDSALHAGVEDEEEYVFVDKDEDQDNNKYDKVEPEADKVDPNKVYKDADNKDPIKLDPVEEAAEQEQ